jgi:hypothetical protein
MASKKRVMSSVPSVVYDRLKNASEVYGLSCSELVCRVVESWLDKEFSKGEFPPRKCLSDLEKIAKECDEATCQVNTLKEFKEFLNEEYNTL